METEEGSEPEKKNGVTEEVTSDPWNQTVVTYFVLRSARGLTETADRLSRGHRLKVTCQRETDTLSL